MKLTEEEKQRLKENLSNINSCPCCGSEASLRYIEIPFQLNSMGFNDNNKMSVIPLVPAICSKCGYTLFFNKENLSNTL